MKPEKQTYGIIGIIEAVDLHRFHESIKDSFSYIGAEALYNYLNELARDTEQNIEFDPVALRCEYTEYNNAIEACGDMGIEAEDEDAAMKKLEYETMIIQFNGGIIVEVF